MSINKNVGLRNHSSSPSAIANMEHHDPSASQKNLDGSPATIKEIHADTSEHAVEDYAVLRVTNTTTSVQYLWVGEEGSSPVTPAIANAMAIAPNTTECIFCGVKSNVYKSIAFKAGSGSLQVIVMYS